MSKEPTIETPLWRLKQLLRAPEAVGVVKQHSGPNRKELKGHIKREVRAGKAKPLPESPIQRKIRDSIRRAVDLGFGKMRRLLEKEKR